MTVCSTRVHQFTWKPCYKLGATLGPFLSDDQSHALGSAVQELAGELGDPGTVTGLTVGLDGRGPG